MSGNKHNISPQNYFHARELVIPSEFCQRVNANGKRGNLLIVHSVWYYDETLKLSPLIFLQVFVVMAKCNGSFHSIWYVLLLNLATNKYIRMFEIIKTAILGSVKEACLVTSKTPPSQQCRHVFLEYKYNPAFLIYTRSGNANYKTMACHYNTEMNQNLG